MSANWWHMILKLLSRRKNPFLFLSMAAWLAGCSSQARVTNYDCESGGQFGVVYGASGVSFEFREKSHTLPATERSGVYSEGDMRLTRTGDEVSLRILDEVVIWGCKEVR